MNIFLLRVALIVRSAIAVQLRGRVLCNRAAFIVNRNRDNTREAAALKCTVQGSKTDTWHCKRELFTCSRCIPPRDPRHLLHAHVAEIAVLHLGIRLDTNKNTRVFLGLYRAVEHNKIRSIAERGKKRVCVTSRKLCNRADKKANLIASLMNQQNFPVSFYTRVYGILLYAAYGVDRRFPAKTHLSRP